MSTLSESRRPRLLAQNRKLRHLKGLSLRNLSFTPAHLRTADDALLPGRSPQRSKLDPLREAKPLQHSRSSESLRKDSALASSSEAFRPQRPQRPRRASLTLSAAHKTPTSRQRTLEGLVDGVVGDVFFTLHIPEEEEPVYISEVRHRSANFNFRFFELGDDQGPQISRSCRLTIRLWAKRPKNPSWAYLLEEHIDLRQLNFIGTLLDRQFPQNALIFHLEDGLYSLDFPPRVSDPRQTPPSPSASYTTLMKLANLESSIDDAMETQMRLMQQINDILEEEPSEGPETAEEEVKLAEKYVSTQQRANRLAERRREELKESLRSRRAAIAEGRELHNQAEDDMAATREKMESNRSLLEETEQKIHGQRRRICSDLSDIFPIVPVPDAPPLSFQICNIPLPNSTYNASIARSINEDVLSAGLGLVALLLRHLQFYLSHPLPYPLQPYGSRSSARDDISQLTDRNTSSRRDFPLYLPRGGSTTGQWRFEYAWFLLNKNIESLCFSQGLRVVDIRHSLPNLKYLLYVCSAGSNQVPERKKGGVRGLWLGRLSGRMSLQVPGSGTGGDGEDSMSSRSGSRRASMDSEIMNQHGEVLRKAVVKGEPEGENGGGGGGGDDNGLLPEISLPFSDGDAKFTLRTKGLRENVGE